MVSLSAAVPAPASVRVGANEIVVSTGAGRAIVDRAPFGIRVLDRRGRVLLESAGRAPARSRRLAPTFDPEPGALELTPDKAVFAPLSFEVGQELLEQWNAGLWNGNVLFSRRSGTTHFARRVLSARRAAGGVRLVVATTDAKRRLLVSVTPDRGGAVRVRVRPSSARGIITTGSSFRAAAGEGFYGFGGRHGSVNKRGEKLYGFTEQENLGGRGTLTLGLSLLPTLVEGGSDYAVDELGGIPAVPDSLPGGFKRYMYPNGPNAAYYPQAQFVSSRGYGFLLNQTEFSRWRMADIRRGVWQVQASAGRLDYSVTFGPGRRRAMRRLSAITGRHRLPPRWAQGPTLSRAVRVPALPGLPAVETSQSYRAAVERDLADIERHDLKLGAYAFEGWALLRDFEYVKSVIRRLRARGIRAIVYHRAYVSDDALATQPAGDFAETRRLGLVAKTATGEPYIFGSNGGAPATLLDFTNPRTVRWWRERLTKLVNAGADGFMQDFGEQVQVDMRFADGSTGRTMHNRYPVLWHRTSRRILDDLAARRREKEPYWFFTRSGYSGRPGSAAYEMANFPGDETTDWGAASGLRSLAPDMLNRGVGGAYGFTADIGGYIDFATGPPDAELFTRWSEWAALTPYFRVHNSAVGGTRMPWSYGAVTLRRWKRLAALHTRATPYMRRLWRDGRRTGLPITRPLWLSAPEAPGAARESQQWLLGPDVLVAPVVQEGATSRRVSFPRGCWQRQDQAGRFRGPARATVPAPLGALPFFFRCGERPF